MRIIPCPECGRMPKIYQCVPSKQGVQRRLIQCPNFCSVIDVGKSRDVPFLEYVGDGDDNMVYKKWNESVDVRLIRRKFDELHD